MVAIVKLFFVGSQKQFLCVAVAKQPSKLYVRGKIDDDDDDGDDDDDDDGDDDVSSDLATTKLT